MNTQNRITIRCTFAQTMAAPELFKDKYFNLTLLAPVAKSIYTNANGKGQAEWK